MDKPVSEMVERVARAIIEACEPQRDFALNKHYSEQLAEVYPVAIAAIKAMREPVEAMTRAGMCSKTEVTETAESSLERFARLTNTIYQEMIDAALGDTNAPQE